MEIPYIDDKHTGYITEGETHTPLYANTIPTKTKLMGTMCYTLFTMMSYNATLRHMFSALRLDLVGCISRGQFLEESIKYVVKLKSA